MPSCDDKVVIVDGDEHARGFAEAALSVESAAVETRGVPASSLSHSRLLPRTR